MHMADALVSPAVALAMYGASAAAAAYSLKKIRLENDARKIPLMGVMGAFVFAAQMLNFAIPGTGSSGHLCGSMLLAALLGAPGAFLTMIGILGIQCLLFADGGILALGCNIWNMAFYGAFVGGALVWRNFARGGLDKSRIIAASLVGAILSSQLGAFSVAVETCASGVSELPFAAFAALMQGIHLAIGIMEGAITASVLLFIYEARPELLEARAGALPAPGRSSFGALLATLAAFACAGAGIFSSFASSRPDGLEWSLARIAGALDEKIFLHTRLHALAGEMQERSALLAGYAPRDVSSAWGTAFAGIAGCCLVFCGCLLCCRLFRWYKYRHKAS